MELSPLARNGTRKTIPPDELVTPDVAVDCLLKEDCSDTSSRDVIGSGIPVDVPTAKFSLIAVDVKSSGPYLDD